jgi:hypothetical protein
MKSVVGVPAGLCASGCVPGTENGQLSRICAYEKDSGYGRCPLLLFY